MMLETTGPSGPDEYKKRQDAIKRTLAKAATKTSAQILKKQAKSANRDNPDVRKNCEMSRMLFNEGLDMYESGDMTFEEFVNDLHKSMMAISGKSMKGEKMSDMESDEDEE